MSQENSSCEPIVGVILAGGRATRMGGGDKPLESLLGRTMLERIIDKMKLQTDILVLNANGDTDRFGEFELPVAPDEIGDHFGPLAGILAGMRWAQANAPDSVYIVSAAADTPFFPDNLVERLSEGCGMDEQTISMAASAKGVHPVFAMWPISLADALEDYLTKKEKRKILTFADEFIRLNVPFDHLVAGGKEIDPFFNVNTPEDLEEAAAIAADLSAQELA